MGENIGKVVQVMGPVIDVEFPQGKLPTIYTALTLSNPAINAEADNLVIEVAQHLGDNVVRTIAMDVTDGLVRGMPVKDTGAPIQMPVGKAALGRVLNVVGRPVDGLGPVSQEKCGRSTAPPRSSPSRTPRCACSKRASKSSTCWSRSPAAARWACSAVRASARRSS